MERKQFTPEKMHQIRGMAGREMYTHSYDHKRPDPDNCAACALNSKRPNYAGWPLLYMAKQRPMPGKWFAAEFKEAQKHNQPYYSNLLDHMFNFGCEIVGD
jgi:hypothetical protein